MIAERHTRTQNLDLALIGNSCAAALVDRNARIVWWCFPHFNSDPVFSRLLAGDEEKGFTDVVLAGLAESQSGYLRNTAIVETVLTDAGGAKLRVTDFAPRFERFEWAFQPPQIIRIEPLPGLPRITAFGLLSGDIHPDTGRALGQSAAFLCLAGIIEL